MVATWHTSLRRCGFNLLELVAVVAILAVLAALALPRLSDATLRSKRDACHVNRAEIEIQARLWRKQAGFWPTASLSDIGADTDYFPEGIPACPLDGATYTIDTSTGKVIGHDH